MFLAFVDDKGFIRVEDKVALRTFIAEGVWKVFGLNVVPHIALVCKRKTTDSTTSCTNFISPNQYIDQSPQISRPDLKRRDSQTMSWTVE